MLQNFAIHRTLDCSSLWTLPKGVDGTINAKILKEALSRTIHGIDLTLSEVSFASNTFFSLLFLFLFLYTCLFSKFMS